MAKFNYQKLSRETALKRKHVIPKEGGSTLSGRDDASVLLNGPEYELRFGKHNGTKLKNLPLSYIEWAILNIKDHRVDMFIRELQRRDPFYRV